MRKLTFNEITVVLIATPLIALIVFDPYIVSSFTFAIIVSYWVGFAMGAKDALSLCKNKLNAQEKSK